MLLEEKEAEKMEEMQDYEQYEDEEGYQINRMRLRHMLHSDLLNL